MPEFCRNLPKIKGLGEMYGDPRVTPRLSHAYPTLIPRLPHAYPTLTPRGPRSLHFRGRRPLPRLPELASSSARPAAALRDHANRASEHRCSGVAHAEVRRNHLRHTLSWLRRSNLLTGILRCTVIQYLQPFELQYLQPFEA